MTKKNPHIPADLSVARVTELPISPSLCQKGVCYKDNSDNTSIIILFISYEKRNPKHKPYELEENITIAYLKGTLPLDLQKANPTNADCTGGVYCDFKSCQYPFSHFNSQKNYNLLGLMQYTVIRLAIKSHF